MNELLGSGAYKKDSSSHTSEGLAGIWRFRSWQPDRPEHFACMKSKTRSHYNDSRLMSSSRRKRQICERISFPISTGSYFTARNATTPIGLEYLDTMRGSITKRHQQIYMLSSFGAIHPTRRIWLSPLLPLRVSLIPTLCSVFESLPPS